VEQVDLVDGVVVVFQYIRRKASAADNGGDPAYLNRVLWLRRYPASRDDSLGVAKFQSDGHACPGWTTTC